MATRPGSTARNGRSLRPSLRFPRPMPASPKSDRSHRPPRVEGEDRRDGARRRGRASARSTPPSSFASEMKMPGLPQGQGPAAARPPAGRPRRGHGGGAARGPARVVRAGDARLRVTPVGDPKLDMPDPPAEGEPLEFTIEVGVRPKAKLGEYKGLEVGRRSSPRSPPRRSTRRSSGCARARRPRAGRARRRRRRLPPDRLRRRDRRRGLRGRRLDRLPARARLRTR